MARKVFSLFDTDRFLREAGAERVSESASKKLRDMLEDAGKEIVSRARVFARHAGRNHVTGKDVLLAAEFNRFNGRNGKLNNGNHASQAKTGLGGLEKTNSIKP